MDIPRDNSLENLVVSSDPDVAASHEFEKIFPEAATVFLMLETDEPFRAGPLTDLERLESELDAIDGVSAFSMATVWRRSRPGAGSPADDLEAFREIAGGSDFFRRQGLVGDNFLAIVLALDAPEPEIRDALLEQVNEIVFAVPEWSQSIDRVRRVGRPWIDAWLERETAASSLKFFPLFAAVRRQPGPRTLPLLAGAGGDPALARRRGAAWGWPLPGWSGSDSPSSRRWFH